MPISRVIPVVIVAVGLIAAKRATAAEPPDGNRLVSATLIADTSAVEPGKPFRVGVKLAMHRHWHVYWENPGDSGVATSIQWSLPQGFTAGPVQWPAPHRFDLSGGLVNFGYEDVVVLVSTITPPAELTSASVDLSASVSWLVCDPEHCLPGSASLRLTLPVGQAERSDAADEIDRFAAQIPRLDPSEVESVHAARSPETGKMELRVTWREAVDAVQWFATPAAEGSFGAVEIDHDAKSTIVRTVVQPAAGNSESAGRNAILAYTNAAGERRGLILSIDK